MSWKNVRDHRGTICVIGEQGLPRSLAGLAWVGRSAPDLRGSFPLDTIAALRYKTHIERRLLTTEWRGDGTVD